MRESQDDLVISKARWPSFWVSHLGTHTYHWINPVFRHLVSCRAGAVARYDIAGWLGWFLVGGVFLALLLLDNFLRAAPFSLIYLAAILLTLPLLAGWMTATHTLLLLRGFRAWGWMENLATTRCSVWDLIEAIEVRVISVQSQCMMVCYGFFAVGLLACAPTVIDWTSVFAVPLYIVIFFLLILHSLLTRKTAYQAFFFTLGLWTESSSEQSVPQVMASWLPKGGSVSAALFGLCACLAIALAALSPFLQFTLIYGVHGLICFILSIIGLPAILFFRFCYLKIDCFLQESIDSGRSRLPGEWLDWFVDEPQR